MNCYFVYYGMLPENNDRCYIHEELSKYREVKVLSPLRFLQRSFAIWPYWTKIGKIISLINYLCNSVRILLKTNRDDVIICESHGTSLILNMICIIMGLPRKIVGFNWIEMPKKRYDYLAESALKNKNYIALINDKQLRHKLIDKYKLKDCHCFFIPDTYDIKDLFKKPIYKKDKYIFSGGINNRDWQTLIECAKQTPYIKYKIVATKDFFCEKNMPANVEVLFDINQESYYKLISEAYITVITLNENKSSGLINIIKSHQYGVPSICTEINAIQIYYPDEIRDKCLCTPKDVDDLVSKVLYMYRLDEKNYIDLSEKIQKYLHKEFSPAKQIKKIVDLLDKYKWEK